MPPPAEPGPARHVDRVTTAEDRAELRALFTELAGHHMVQLRDFMIEVRCGSALAEWIALSEPAVRSVRGMAEQLELDDICEALDRLLGALTAAHRSGGAISQEHQAALLAAYLPLIDLLPGVLELDAERNRREPIIVHSLLLQIPGIEKVAIDKLVAANLVSVSALSEARPEELAQVTGLAGDLAARVVARFREYRQQSGAVASADPRAELRALTDLVARLRQQNGEYDSAAGSWAPGVKEEKRRLRRERAATLLAIHVSLARLGEVDRLVELDRLNFRRKVEFIESTLQAARAATRARTGPA
ncbi:MAG TPA: helix-hairpin-helix domain-containing protein [Kofleriaceae bacterium]|nr:helix-hairpin-helix domain-containing protein [Kofleriaceae bacterium]